MIKIQRIYSSNIENGYRVLVDKIWPRGIRRMDAPVDIWMKEVAPSDALRKWFGHDPERFDEFKKKYRMELNDNPEIEKLIQLVMEHNSLILLFGAKDELHNQAIVLREYIEEICTNQH